MCNHSKERSERRHSGRLTADKKASPEKRRGGVPLSSQCESERPALLGWTSAIVSARCRLSVEYGIRLLHSSLFIIAQFFSLVKPFCKFFSDDADGDCFVMPPASHFQESVLLSVLSLPPFLPKPSGGVMFSNPSGGVIPSGGSMPSGGIMPPNPPNPP